MAACLTLLSYTATAVVSAFDAVAYLQGLWPEASSVYFPVVILAVFALLSFFGMRESANVALVIFAFHLTVMTMLIFDCLIRASQVSKRGKRKKEILK